MSLAVVSLTGARVETYAVNFAPDYEDDGPVRVQIDAVSLPNRMNVALCDVKHCRAKLEAECLRQVRAQWLAQVDGRRKSDAAKWKLAAGTSDDETKNVPGMCQGCSRVVLVNLEKGKPTKHGPCEIAHSWKAQHLCDGKACCGVRMKSKEIPA